MGRGIRRVSAARLAPLDYLRGLMALAVLAFHYQKWLSGTWNPATLQGRLGVYAVSIFFIISGLTLTLVYESTLDHRWRTSAAFGIKRAFRILPLLWLATAATLALDDFARPTRDVFLNLTGLFGFANPARDIALGAWSIGCEWVYYAFFPALILLVKWRRAAFAALFVLLLGVGAWAAFGWMPAKMDTPQAEWWPIYTLAANHAFFFAGGMAMAIWRAKLTELPLFFWRSALIVSAFAFWAWPVGTSPLGLVQGWGRVVLSLLAVVFAAAFFQSKLEMRGWPHRVLAWLGTVSYALYLLHPLAFRAAKALNARFFHSSEVFVAVLAFGATLAASHVSYFLLEKPLMRAGARWAKRVGA
jgi:exopolysaccharide production protein ExoZ